MLYFDAFSLNIVPNKRVPNMGHFAISEVEFGLVNAKVYPFYTYCFHQDLQLFYY
jgi:hypothetical protein